MIAKIQYIITKFDWKYVLISIALTVYFFQFRPAVSV